MEAFSCALQRGVSTLIGVTILALPGIASAGTATASEEPAGPAAISCKPLPAQPEKSAEPMTDVKAAYHFYSFNDRMRDVFRNPRQSDEAVALEYLRLAQLHEGDWNYGNAIHEANSVLGLLALQLGDLALARECLRIAGATRGSPQLNSFGPNMQLADALAQAGEFEAVAKYLVQVRRFWRFGSDRIDRWLVDLAASRTPDFCSNLRPLEDNPRLEAKCGHYWAQVASQPNFNPVKVSRRTPELSRKAELAASPTTEFPYAGFWKTKADCSHDFGLAIAPAGSQGSYSVSFCGPGGCFEPGKYRPNTPLVNDPAYEVIDANTIGVGRCDGSGDYHRYYRCPGRALTQ